MTDITNLELDLYTEIPDDVLRAARLVEHWTKSNGWMKWCIGGIADRALVEDLQHRINMIRGAIKGSI